MPSYDWTCQVCSRPNSKQVEACPNCGCPAETTGGDIEHRKQLYAGPLHGATGNEQLSDGTFANIQGHPYLCSKCGHNRCRIGEIRASGGFMSAVFEVQTERFSYVACSRCHHAEFYACEASVLGMVVDYFVG